ncbi:uncharacterized protein VTP21DRAFT_5863 [Calcarisporiella thermophila]|uniref:uncharacterized protein n=1 Tax=Calcarisporiella thermophila TaxID=911321 RepID=UPI0037437F4B
MTLPVGVMNYASIVDGHFVVLDGYMSPNTSYVLDYDVAKSVWSRPPQSGNIPPRTHSGALASTKDGRNLFLLGGVRNFLLDDTITDVKQEFYYPELYSYQYDNGHWILERTSVALEPRILHTMTAVSDDTLIVIGGERNQTVYGLEYVDVIESISGAWKRVATKGLPVNASARIGHSAVRKGTQIFVYGGFVRIGQAMVLSLPSLLVLDTTTLTWSVPTLKNESKSRFTHTTFMYNDKYLVTLSGATKSSIDEVNFLNGGSMQILDIDTLTFVDEFDPFIQVSPTNSNNGDPNTMALGLGLGLGLGGGALIASILLFVLIKRRKVARQTQQEIKLSQMYEPSKEFPSTSISNTNMGSENIVRRDIKIFSSGGVNYADQTEVSSRCQHQPVQISQYLSPPQMREPLKELPPSKFNPGGELGFRSQQSSALPHFGSACGFDPSTKLLICYGGFVSVNNEITRKANEVYSLSLNLRFKTASPPWQQVFTPSAMSLPIGTNNYASVVDGHLVVVGGQMSPDTNYVLDCDMAKNVWTLPTQSGILPPRTRAGALAATVLGRRLYLLGGLRDYVSDNTVTNKSEVYYYSELYTYQYDYGNWAQVQTKVALEPRVRHTMTAMADGTLVVIGGVGNKNTTVFGLENMDVFEPISGSWKRVATKGLPPGASVRLGHSAVRRDTKIIVYGGVIDYTFLFASPSLLILDTATYTWSVPDIKSAPNSRYMHTSFLYNDKYLITVGGIHASSPDKVNYQPGMQILDVDTFTYVDELDPSAKSTTSTNTSLPNAATPSSQQTSESTTGINTMALGLGLGIGGALIIGALLFVFVKRRKIALQEQQQQELQQHLPPPLIQEPPKELPPAPKYTDKDSDRIVGAVPMRSASPQPPRYSSTHYSPDAAGFVYYNTPDENTQGIALPPSPPQHRISYPPNEVEQNKEEIYAMKPDEA